MSPVTITLGDSVNSSPDFPNIANHSQPISALKQPNNKLNRFQAAYHILQVRHKTNLRHITIEIETAETTVIRIKENLQDDTGKQKRGQKSVIKQTIFLGYICLVRKDIRLFIVILRVRCALHFYIKYYDYKQVFLHVWCKA